jgi:HTH-type transcriptional regulator/antitoxin HipB
VKPSTAPHTTPSTGRHQLASQRRESDEYRQGHAEAQRAYLLGKAVRDRGLALGLSQVALAARPGMTQPALSRLKAGGVIPTIPLLDRISATLDADLIVQIAPHAAYPEVPERAKLRRCRGPSSFDAGSESRGQWWPAPHGLR